MSTETIVATTVTTPVGPLAVLASPDGVVRAAGFATVATMAARLEQASGPFALREVGPDSGDPALSEAVDAVHAYAAGDLGALGRVRVSQPGGPFMQDVWVAMRTIAPGDTATYAELAAAAGRPAAVRAAGSACARNLVAPFVPCHRVVRTGGGLGGYYYGLDVKRSLLQVEQVEQVGQVGQVEQGAQVEDGAAAG